MSDEIVTVQGRPVVIHDMRSYCEIHLCCIGYGDIWLDRANAILLRDRLSEIVDAT